MNMKMIEITKNLGLLLFAIALSSCGQKKPQAIYEQRPEVPSSFTGLDDDPSNGDDSIGSGDSAKTACEYWNELPVSDKFFGAFQLFENFDIQNQTAIGVVNFATLPQARYGLSTEYRDGKSPLPDVWTFDKFYAFAVEKIRVAKVALEKKLAEAKTEEEKKKIKKQIKELDDKKKNLDLARDYPWLPFVEPRKKALVARNESIVAEIETSLPGAFSGNQGPLTQSPIFQQLTLAMGSLTPDFVTLSAQKARINKKVPLFLSSNWTIRRFDLQKALGTLKGSALTPAEKLCRHLVAQRTMAQLLSLKGMNGAPLVSSRGRLAALPAEWDVEYDTTKVSGQAYNNTVINEAWILSQLARSEDRMSRMTGTESTEQFFEALRFWLSLSSHRLESTWQAGKDPLPNKLNLPTSLFKMGFGIMGIHLSIFRATEFSILPPELRGPSNGYVRIRQDGPDNLARLILITRETLRGMGGLRNPDDLAHKVLLPSQTARFTQPEIGVLAQFTQLRTAATLEGFIRMRNGQGSETLGDVLEEVRRP